MKIVNWIFVTLFVLAAALQYNDPDPYIWMPLYLYGAVLCYQATQKKYIRPLYLLGLVVYIAYAIFLFVDRDGVLSWMQEHEAENIVQSMKATKPWIEETREFFGLFILIIALVINMIWLSKVKRETSNLKQKR